MLVFNVYDCGISSVSIEVDDGAVVSFRLVKEAGSDKKADFLYKF